MTRERSEPDFNKYDRPQQAWNCGRSQFGTPCPLGPSRLGICQQASDCEPAFKNDRWVCNRSQQNGGPCDTGPDCDGGCAHVRDKCVPTRSLRNRRGVFVFGCLALTIGLTFYVLFVPWRLEVLAPGGLTRNHAQILSRNTHENRCVECHEAGSLTLFELITEGFADKIHSQQTQSQKCLKCHDKSFDATHALHAHSMPPSELSKLTARYSGRDKHSTLLVSKSEKGGEIACSTCHREHHGAEHDLTRITDRQCAVCHSSEFESFANHPEFRSWPRYQNEQIKFDHASHKFKHFAKDGKSFQCSDCHSLSANNEIIVATGFESCKSCHEDAITTSATDGVVFFALPMVDVDTLADEGIEVENWPEYAQGDFDGIIPPLMRLMLWERQSLRPHLELLDDDWDFANLDPDDPEHLEAAGRIADAIKTLLSTLAEDNEESKALIRRVIGADSDTDVNSFLAPFVFQSAQSRWFADAGNSDDQFDTSIDDESTVDQDSSGDELLDAEPDHELLDEDANDNELLDDDELLDDELLDDESFEDQPGQSPEDDDDLLSKNQRELINVHQIESNSKVVPASFQQDNSSAQSTGWFRDDDAFAIGYRPQKHADVLMKQLLSQLAKADASATLKQACFSQLAAPTATGQCISCHAVERQDETASIRWIARERTTRGFNRFSHSPHLLQPQLRDCSHCHELSETSDSPRFVDSMSDFKSITKHDCSSCHNKKAAGDSCTKCHAYHVHSFGFSR